MTTHTGGMGRKRNSHSLLVGIQIRKDILKISAVNPQKTKHKSIILSIYTTPWHMPQRLDILFHRHLLCNVCSCPIHNSQEIETDELIMKMCYKNTIKYYLSVKKS